MAAVTQGPPAGHPPVSRRERLRTATVAEIKQTARQLLVSGGLAGPDRPARSASGGRETTDGAGGASAISLRAIAREMGMTAPAIYRYFPSLEALVMALCADLYEELGAAVGAARAPLPADAPVRRLTAMAQAFRRWSIANRAEFALMFGEPMPGVPAVDDSCAPPPGVVGFCDAFLTEFLALWRARGLRTPPPEVISERLAGTLVPATSGQGAAMAGYFDALAEAGLPPEVMYLFLSGWVRLYGMVAMEVFGHLSWAVTDVEPLFDTVMAAYFHEITGSTDS